jgi:glutamyl-tRNA reductase
MNLFCIGINHRTAPLDVRESVWYSNEEIGKILPLLKSKNLQECVFVSTCNRTELYGLQTEGSVQTEELLELIIHSKNTAHRAQPHHFYTLQSLFVGRHLFSVSSGIDSMVLGDVQILNQTKEAFDLAKEAGTVGTILTKLFQSALHTGKRARTETEIGQGAVSVSYAAAELAGKIFDDLSKRKALLVGAGETGKLTAKHLAGKGIGKLYLTNRTKERTGEIAARLDGTVVEFERMKEAMETCDIVITSVTSPSYILTAQDVHTIMKHRANKPLFVIDIGVPRNVDPAANNIDNVFLHNIDTLNIVVDRNLQKREAEARKVQRIVHEEVLKFYQWFNSLQVTPTIQELRDQFETIREREVEHALHHFSREQRESVEMLTKRIVNKILHTPIVNLKNGADGEASEETLKKLSVIRHLFGLGHKSEHSKK